MGPGTGIGLYSLAEDSDMQPGWGLPELRGRRERGAQHREPLCNLLVWESREGRRLQGGTSVWRKDVVKEGLQG